MDPDDHDNAPEERDDANTLSLPRLDDKYENLLSFTNDDREAMRDNGITSIQDLVCLGLDGRVDIFNMTVLAGKKLELVCSYLESGGSVTANTSIISMTRKLKQISMSVQTPQVAPTAPVAPPPPDKAPTNRFTIEKISHFNGDADEWTEWYKKTKTKIGQTGFRFILSNTAPGTSLLEKNEEFYFMLQEAVQDGSAEYIIDNVDNHDGYTAWLTLRAEYSSSDNTSEAIESTTEELDDLFCDDGDDMLAFINKYSLLTKRLDTLGEGYSAMTKRNKFLNRIRCLDYATTKDALLVRRQTGPLSFDECVRVIKVRAKQLRRESSDALAQGRQRRGHTFDQTKSSYSQDSPANIPSIPAWIIDRIPDNTVIKDLFHWRAVANRENRPIDISESRCAKTSGTSNPVAPPPSKDTKKIPTKAGKGKRNKKSYRNRRGQVDTEKFSFKGNALSDDEADDNNDSDMVVRIWKRLRRTSGRERPRVILDSGADTGLASCRSWVKIKEYPEYVNMKGPDHDGMGRKLPIVDACTAVDLPHGEVVLFAAKNMVWYNDVRQTETLMNVHHIRQAGAICNDVRKEHGGAQSIEFNDTFLALDWVDNATLSFHSRCPTAEEMQNLPIHVLSDAKCDLKSTPDMYMRNLVTSSREPVLPTVTQDDIPTGSDSDTVTDVGDTVEQLLDEIMPRPSSATPAPSAALGTTTQVLPPPPVDVPNPAEVWKGRLGYCTAEVMAKTLGATTQLVSNPVAMETQALPRQHQQKRIHPLHPRRIPGMSASDTFFSAVKSIRGFTCCQVFFVMTSHFLQVFHMRRESQSHGAYLDFIRLVGAPAKLLTDNSKTQTGKKWTDTSRLHCIEQRRTVPHNQRQNPAERKIRDLKHRVWLILLKSGAPTSFWCYATSYAADVLNRTAHKPLSWRTPEERLNGFTPDISALRFHFWQDVEYFEPGAHWPEGKMCKAKYLGVARQHGDEFSYIVWTLPDNDFRLGRELIRNIVRIDPAATNSSPLQPSQVKLDWKFGKSRKVVPDGPPPEELPFACDPTLSHVPAQNVNPLPTIPEEPPEEDLSTEPETVLDFDPTEEASVELVEAVHDAMDDIDTDIGGASVASIIRHRMNNRKVQFEVLFSDDATMWVYLDDMQADHPELTARYIIDHNVRSRKSGKRDLVQAWASKFLRDHDRTIRRLDRIYAFCIDDKNDIYRIRRNVPGSPKKRRKKFDNSIKFRYGVQVPRNVQEALDLDRSNGDTSWQEAIEKEIGSLTKMDCFEFHDVGYVHGSDFQKATLRMIFDVKNDLRRKARLVAGGHLIDVKGQNCYSSTVKGVSIRLLHVVAHKQALATLCGDVGNAFVNAYTKEKVYCVAGPEFGTLAGRPVTIKKALYGLRTSAERWHAHFADTLRDLGFTPTRFDNDVWIRENKESGKRKGYDYIATHVDDFKIFSVDPAPIMKAIQARYIIKDIGPPNYYLGNNFKRHDGKWLMGCEKYIAEALSRVEKMFPDKITKNNVPMLVKDHPELDDSALLTEDMHRKYQMLLGMLNWAVCIGRFDIAYATSSLSRFSAAPRKGHLRRALHVFGYLKKRPNAKLAMDAARPSFPADDEMTPEQLAEFRRLYPDAEECLDPNVPEARWRELQITVFVDSDHAHDQLTRRSVTGLIILVGCTPVTFFTKRQSAIATSTYSAEFTALRVATEEVTAIRYMLRCLGVRVTEPSRVYCDNLGVLQNATISQSLLKKKHVALCYHSVREAVAAGIIMPFKVASKDNIADVLTKPLANDPFSDLTGRILYG